MFVLPSINPNQVAAGEVSVASLHEQAAALQRTLAQAQAAAREQALQANQQVGMRTLCARLPYIV